MGNQTAIGIASTTFAIFVALAVFLPIIYAEFGVSGSTVNTEGFEFDVTQEQTGTTVDLSVVDVFTKVLFWSFGTFPIWLDAFLLFLKIILAISLFSIIRG